ncbi:MAG: stage II sporulation protein M [Promethearchaeati archaeon SRVP18_Atabeyarchaeia-1]
MTDLTLLYVFGPAVLISLFFLLWIRSRIYKGIARTLLLVVWVNAFMVLLWLVTSGELAWSGSAQGVNEGILLAQLSLSAFQSGAYVLEQLLLWGFVAFFAVIIGSIYLLITCMRKKGGSLAEKMSQVSFKGSVQNPLTSGFDIMGLQSYLIIGLATMPSMISILMGMDIAQANGSLSLFSYSVVYYVLLFYRFSLMAYTRIAKRADLHYGKEDLGQKYQQRIFGRFTVLNLLLSVVLLGYSVITAPGALGYLAGDLVVELRSLLVAILVLPFVEGFATFFFMRFWHFWSKLGTRVRSIKWKSALYSLTRGILVGGACFVLFYSILSFVTAATTFFNGLSSTPVFNNQIGAVDIYSFIQGLGSTLGTRYDVLVLPALWGLIGVFLFQFIKVLIGGSLTHRKDTAPEYSIVVAGITIAVLIWVIMPATNFLLGAFPASLTTDGQTWSTLTMAFVPQPLQQEFFTIYYVVPAPSVLLYAVFLDFPIWIFGSLLLTYFFVFRRPLVPQKKEEVDVFISSDFFKLFISFCAVAVASVASLMAISSVTPFGDAVHALLSKLWFPNARDLWLFQTVGSSWIFFHNVIRFLLTVFTPLVLWISLTGIWKWLRNEKVEGKPWYLLAIALFVLEGVFFVDRFTYIAVIAIPLVFAAIYRGFYRLVKRTSPKTRFRTTFLKISFYSLILCEIYSTAIAFADRYMFPIPPATQSFAAGGNLGLLFYLLILVPHGLIEIPAIMLAGMIGLYIARRMTPVIDADEKKLGKFMTEGKNLLFSKKIWYPILFVTIFFAVAAVIEIYVSYGPMEQLANMFGFA